MGSIVETYIMDSKKSESSVNWLIILAALSIGYIYFKISRRRLYELADKIPGPPGLPLIGNFKEMLGTSNEIFVNIYRQSNLYGSVIKAWYGPRLVIALLNPEDIEVILGSQVHLEKSTEYRFFEPWLGNGLLISKGDIWRTHRKIIAPTFHLNILKSFMGLFNINSKEILKKIREHQHEFDIHDYMSECTVNVLLDTVMGLNNKTKKGSGFEYAKAVMGMCEILHLRQIKVWLRSQLIFSLTKYKKLEKDYLNIIHSLTLKVLKEKKRDYFNNKMNKNASAETNLFDSYSINNSQEKNDEGKGYYEAVGLKDDLDVDDDIGQKKRSAFLDYLIESSENGNVLSETEIKEEVDTIMFEGHDTTAAACSFFLCLMGTLPEIQKKVIEEIDGIFGDSDRDCTFQDTVEMKYLERCILETLRLYPPVPIIARKTNEEINLASGYTIPSGITVIIGTFVLHRNGDIYKDPEVFNPDNFLPENAANRHYYSYIPFSAGPRSCVGRKYAMLKLKVILSTFLRNFKVKPGIPEDKWKLQADIILKRTDGFNLAVEPRKKVASNNQAIKI